MTPLCLCGVFASVHVLTRFVLIFLCVCLFVTCHVGKGTSCLRVGKLLVGMSCDGARSALLSLPLCMRVRELKLTACQTAVNPAEILVYSLA